MHSPQYSPRNRDSQTTGQEPANWPRSYEMDVRHVDTNLAGQLDERGHQQRQRPGEHQRDETSVADLGKRRENAPISNAAVARALSTAK